MLLLRATIELTCVNDRNFFGKAPADYLCGCAAKQSSGTAQVALGVPKAVVVSDIENELMDVGRGYRDGERLTDECRSIRSQGRKLNAAVQVQFQIRIFARACAPRVRVRTKNGGRLRCGLSSHIETDGTAACSDCRHRRLQQRRLCCFARRRRRYCGSQCSDFGKYRGCWKRRLLVREAGALREGELSCKAVPSVRSKGHSCYGSTRDIEIL